MKTSYLFKIMLLALPIVLLIYVFLIRDRISGATGIGGGGYDLTRMYTLIAAGLYLLIFNLVLLIQGARENKLLLLIGTIALILTIVAAVRSF
jgi:hypothetical protein